MTVLPPLDRIFFDDDGEEHAADSCCLSLNRPFFSDKRSKWIEVRDQHLEALMVLVDQADGIQDEGDGWWLARPIVYGAHHTVELALKTANLTPNPDWPGNGHDLRKLLDLDEQRRGDRETKDWEDRFVALLEDAWIARYPFEKGGAETMKTKCCVSASALLLAVTVLMDLVDPAPVLQGTESAPT